MWINVTYGLGGYDPTKPNNNIVAITEYEDEEQEWQEPAPLGEEVAQTEVE